MSKTSKIVFRCDFWNVDGGMSVANIYLVFIMLELNQTLPSLHFVYLYVMADDKLNVPFL